MARLRIFLPPGIERIYASTSRGRWKPETSIRARKNKGWRWATIADMPEGAYVLFTDIDNPWSTEECLPEIWPPRTKVRYFAGTRDEEIRPEHFKGRRTSIWN